MVKILKRTKLKCETSEEDSIMIEIFTDKTVMITVIEDGMSSKVNIKAKKLKKALKLYKEEK